MELGILHIFIQDKEHCQHERGDCLFHFLYLDCLRLTNRQPKSWMQAPASSSQVDLPSWGCVCCGSNIDLDQVT